MRRSLQTEANGSTATTRLLCARSQISAATVCTVWWCGPAVRYRGAITPVVHIHAGQVQTYKCSFAHERNMPHTKQYHGNTMFCCTFMHSSTMELFWRYFEYHVNKILLLLTIIILIKVIIIIIIIVSTS